MAEIHEIADGIYRISIYPPNSPVTYTQFVIKDEQPLLYHTGSRSLFPETLDAVKQVLDPATLRYISWSHLESDECGAINDFLALALNAEPVHGETAIFLGVGDFTSRPIKGMADGAVLDLGSHKLQFLITPHVPHCWDAIMAFEETTGTLLCSDLFTQFGKPDALTTSDIVEPAMKVVQQLPDYLPIGQHTARVLSRVEDLPLKVLAGHHAPAFDGDAVRAVRELREALMALDGS